MSKIHRNSKFLALTLTASIATFGCTTNWNRSEGEPEMGATNVNSPSATPGTSGGTLPQPMMSSSRFERTPEEALAIMQQSRSIGPQGIVLGPANPPMTGEARIGGYTEPPFDGRLRQLTVNSSIANPMGPLPVIVSGAGEGADAAALFGDIVVGTAVTPSTTATSGAAGIVAGVPVPSNIGAAAAATTAPATLATAPTPTSASIPVTSGVFSAATGTLTPSASSSAVPTPTVATSPVVLGTTGMLSSSAVTNGGAVTITAPATATALSRSGRVQAPLRLNRGGLTTGTTSRITVTQDANGKLVISNVK